jgi:hypothetical protein
MKNERGRERARILSAIIVVSALALAACGYDSSDSSGSTSTTMGGDMEEMDHDHDGGHEVAWSPPPSVSVTATETGPGTFDLQIDAESFAFVDVDAPPDVVEGEGHAHVLLDDRVVTMVYGDTYQLEDVPPGEHEVSVQLSAADHQSWLIGGEPVEDTTTVTVAGDVPEADETIEVTVAGGSVEGGAERHSVAAGSVVALSVTSDEADEVHLHGYDITEDVEAGGTATIVFTADIPGIFEVELEGSGTMLAELEVS